MIHLFANAIEPTITSLSFIERWGGAVMPIQARSSYTGPDGQQVSVMQSFPVSCSLDELCDPQADGYYSKLLPDDAYASVAYLEGIGRADISQDGIRYIIIRQRAKLTVWLNMQRLGALGCGLVEVFALQTAKAINTNRRMEIAEDVYQYQAVASATVTALHFDMANIFGQYTYAIEQRLIMNPYSAFALEIDFEASIPLACLCLPEFESVECVEQW